MERFIAAAAMVWHDCLLTTNDEHLITLQGGLRGLKIETGKNL